MPFTLSHAAAALPFRKFKPVWSALVVGTFAPDLQYFIRVSDEDRSGHHFPAVLFLTVPLAFTVLALFERVIKGAVVQLLPSGLLRRLKDKTPPLAFWGWRQFSSILFWILVGILTHLVWDQFTHANTRTAAYWPLLRMIVSPPLLYPRPVAKVLQDLSTILGFFILCAWSAGWYLRTEPAPKSAVSEFAPWVKVTIVCCLVALAAALGYPYAIFTIMGHDYPIVISRAYLAATVFESVTMFLFLEVTLYGLAYNLALRVRGSDVSRKNASGVATRYSRL